MRSRNIHARKTCPITEASSSVIYSTLALSHRLNVFLLPVYSSIDAFELLFRSREEASSLGSYIL